MSKVIALDAGHGMGTSGKQTPDGIKEWELNDKVRDKVVEKLSPYDVKFIFPDNNEGKKDESLSSRKSMYIKGRASAAVSLHHNALKNKFNSVTGVEVFVDNNATERDLELANLIYKKLVEYTGLKGRGIKRANFTVICQNQVPAVLVEGGFMDGKNDYKVITSDKGQDAYARAVAESLIEFCKLKKKETEVKPAAQPETKPATTPTKTETKNTFKSYTVKITADTLNVRNGAGVLHKVNTKVKKGEVYTIVDEKNGWGKLKSGAGWIKLSYTTKNETKATIKPENKLLSVGCKVKIKSTAKNYCTGQKIPVSIKAKTYTVKQIGTGQYPKGVLLKEISSWVNSTDLTIQ